MSIVLIAGSVLVSLMIAAAFAVRRPSQAVKARSRSRSPNRPSQLFLDVDGVIALATPRW